LENVESHRDDLKNACSKRPLGLAFSVVPKLRCALLLDKKTIAIARWFDILKSFFAGNGGGKTVLIFAFE
jgi:hypothetical protein